MSDVATTARERKSASVVLDFWPLPSVLERLDNSSAMAPPEKIGVALATASVTRRGVPGREAASVTTTQALSALP